MPVSQKKKIYNILLLHGLLDKLHNKKLIYFVKKNVYKSFRRKMYTKSFKSEKPSFIRRSFILHEQLQKNRSNRD